MKAAIDKILSLSEGEHVQDLQHHLTPLSNNQVCDQVKKMCILQKAYAILLLFYSYCAENEHMTVW